MCRSWIAGRGLRRFLGFGGVAVCLLLAAPDAHAQRGRASRAAMMKARAHMEAYQRDVMRYQQEMAAKQAEIVKQFDANGDGQLRGPEKSKFDRHMHYIQTGREPNPFASILPPGQGPEMKSVKK